MRPKATATVATAADVADYVRNSIISGDMVSGQRLVEADLAEAVGASRGHVRAALAELTVEGLVERIQNRGARVRQVSVEEALEITEVRAAVEALCAAKAAEKRTDDDAVALREIGERMKNAVDTGDQAAYAQGNTDLHETLIRVADQRTAADTISRLNAQAVRYQYRLSAQPGRPSVSLPEHLAVIDAVCKQDAKAARDAMECHLNSVRSAIQQAADNR